MTQDELFLRIYGDPVLRERSKEVTEFGDRLNPIIERMYEIMYEEEGVGLAGPQAGVSERIVVLDVPLEDGGTFNRVLINPRILEHEGTQKGPEGCLSIPGLREDVARYDTLQVEAEDPGGNTIEFSCDQLLSRAVQHEIDHLNGVLFVDRLSPVRRRLLGKRLKKMAAEQESAAS